MPKIDWKKLDNYKDLEQIFAALGADNARLVGGCVRDIIAGRKVTDFDFATPHTPEHTQDLLEKAGIKSVPTGIKYGTITAVIEKKNYEITTLRKDVETFGRDANVEFTDIWEEDAKRRDFTINALYMSADGEVFDYFEGQKDLENRLLRFIGDPKTRIEEDFLRILRYFRFIAYFDANNLDMASLTACKDFREGLLLLSGERIHNELVKMFHVEHFCTSVRLMEETGALKVLGFEKRHNLPKSITNTEKYHIRFAIFLMCYSAQEDRLFLLKKYKFSNEEIRKILLVADWDYGGDFGEMIKNVRFYKGADSARDLITAYGIITDKPVVDYDKYLGDIAKFPINGDDLKKIGYNGVRLGRKLRNLEAKWIRSDFTLSKEELLEE